jgi:CelD/BcsL family acetyltransferase involved in cellulose biosynthesis
MNIRVIPADALTPEHIAAWASIQRADAALDSPYFRPEFTQAVAAVRDDVEVGVLEEGDEPVGFFPFQRGRNNVARPVGGRMSDFHGVVVRKDVAWDPRQLLCGCALSAWHFDHLIASQEPFQPCHWTVAPSPYMDLSIGWEGYRREQLAQHKTFFKQVDRKSRAAVRRIGPLRVEIDANSPAVFRKLVEWKMGQYRRSAGTNVLAFDWTTALLQRVLAAEGEAFHGMLSALYLGDALAAVLLSMRSYDVVHAWFTAYDPDMAQLSPGLILWLQLAEAYPTSGVRRIDLGKGPEEYKQHLMSGAIDLAEGSVDFRPLMAAVRRNWHRAYQWARRSPLRRPLLAPARFLRRIVESRSFR